MIDGDELRARILAQPETEAFLVYGDYLAERGDPRGELVSVQTRLVAHPADRQLRAREAELFASHRAAWLGPLAELPRDQFCCTWSNGFLDWAELGSETPEDLVDALFALPHIGFVRRLTLAGRTRDYHDALARLGAHAPAGLRALDIRGLQSSGPPRTALGDGGPLAKLPALRALSLRVDWPALHTVGVPGLSALAIHCPHLEPGDMAAFEHPRWASLERLELHVARDDESSPATTPAALAPILALPNLRVLVLRGASDLAALIDQLAAAPVLAHLESLDLRDAVVDEPARGAFARHARLLRRVHAIELSRSNDDDEVDSIDGLPNVTFDDAWD